MSLLEELPREGSRMSLNALEEFYLGLLLDYKRMRGSAAALETALSEMQHLFDLSSEKEVEQSERLARKMRGSGVTSARNRSES